MRITDVRCAVLGGHPIVRVVTDEGLCGHGQIEFWKPFAKAHVALLAPNRDCKLNERRSSISPSAFGYAVCRRAISLHLCKAAVLSSR